jgi:hypothetical protein
MINKSLLMLVGASTLLITNAGYALKIVADSFGTHFPTVTIYNKPVSAEITHVTIDGCQYQLNRGYGLLIFSLDPTDPPKSITVFIAQSDIADYTPSTFVLNTANNPVTVKVGVYACDNDMQLTIYNAAMKK